MRPSIFAYTLHCSGKSGMRPITIVESATAEGIREAAKGVETPGSYQAAQLRVAEQYVEKLGLLAKEKRHDDRADYRW